MKNDRITIRIPSSLIGEINKERKDRKISMSDIIREALIDHFNGKKKNEDVTDVLKDIRDILRDVRIIYGGTGGMR